jgi:hypothetical protein
MHATVMYQRWVFDEFMFDTSLHIVKIMTYILKL